VISFGQLQKEEIQRCEINESACRPDARLVRALGH
jgi:hypothetical protein